jgi:ABC-2 type transport system ATP-binding protein
MGSVKGVRPPNRRLPGRLLNCWNLSDHIDRGKFVPAIETRMLVKQFDRITALRGVSLQAERGQIFGLLGQNGAGKTTLVKILLGITRLTSGEARLLDEPAGIAPVRRQVGYLPEDHRFPDYHSGASLLHFYGALLGVSRLERKNRVPAVLDRVGLTGRQHYKIRTYSKGMKQRLGIAQAIFHDPKVIFLDEPTDGVDPLGRREIRGILQSLKDEGKTIFLNSHLLSEVELLCDHVAILQKGEVIREGDIASLTRRKGLFLIGLADGQSLPEPEITRMGYEVRPDGGRWEIHLSEGQSIDPVIDLLRSRQLNLRHLLEKRQSLEDLFLETVAAAEPGIDVPRARSVRAK